MNSIFCVATHQLDLTKTPKVRHTFTKKRDRPPSPPPYLVWVCMCRIVLIREVFIIPLFFFCWGNAKTHKHLSCTVPSTRIRRECKHRYLDAVASLNAYKVRLIVRRTTSWILEMRVMWVYVQSDGLGVVDWCSCRICAGRLNEAYVEGRWLRRRGDWGHSKSFPSIQ